MIDLYKGDCLEVMDRLISQNIVVDAIITDVPFNTTACDWDFLIPFNNHIMLSVSKRSKKLKPIYKDEYILQELKAGREYQEICEYFDTNSKEGMWSRLNKLIKPNGAIVLFGSEPFSSALRMSNIKNFKYDWKWNKKIASNFASANKQPLRITEDIMIFNSKIYYPLKTKGKMRKKGGGKQFVGVYGDSQKDKITEPYLSDMYHPTNIIEIGNAKRKGKVHPTQKPVALGQYLIRTYTNKGETILDFTAGSGSFGVSAIREGRMFIGIELNNEYFKIMEERIKKELQSNSGYGIL